MYSFLQSFHSYWAYAALILLLIAIVNAFIGLSGKKEFTIRDRKFSLYGMIACHIQLLVGIILLFLSPYWSSMMEMGMGDAMGDQLLRLYTVEHPLTNILAIVLITIGWSKHKKTEETARKFKSIAYLYLAGLLLLLSRIPWSAWHS